MSVKIHKFPNEQGRELHLLKRSQKGDIAAFEELALAYQKRIFYVALRMLGHHEDAADMTQEVLLKIYRNLHKFRGDAAFSTWVYRITVNTCRDTLRRGYRQHEGLLIDFGEGDEQADSRRDIADYSALPESLLEEKEVEKYLFALIDGLTPKYRLVVSLREISGLGYQEIADAIGISVGTVKSRLSRARKCMQEQVQADAEHYPHLLRLTGQRGDKDGLQ